MRRTIRIWSAVGGSRLFYALSALASYLSGRGAGYERVHELVTATRQRIAVRGWVGAAVEYFSPQSRTAGGYGVVASVDSSTQVTLAAGYTLGAGGRCRLWDRSAGVHLDSGGVEWRRSGAVVTLPDTTGMAANDVVYSDRLEFNDYAQCVALETALGTSFNGELRLLNRTSGAVILRRVVRSGAWVSTEVDFASVTATPCAACASVAGAVVTLTAPHTITATLAKVLRVQVVTDGTWSDVASGAWSVSGNDVTVPQATADAIAAALGASKSVRVHVEGVSELCIGGAGCAVQPAAGAFARFNGTRLAVPAIGATSTYVTLPIGHPCSDRARAAVVSRAYFDVTTTGAAAGQYGGVGMYMSATQQYQAGIQRDAGNTKWQANGRSGSLASPAAFAGFVTDLGGSDGIHALTTLRKGGATFYHDAQVSRGAVCDDAYSSGAVAEGAPIGWVVRSASTAGQTVTVLVERLL